MIGCVVDLSLHATSWKRSPVHCRFGPSLSSFLLCLNTMVLSTGCTAIRPLVWDFVAQMSFV